MERLVKRGPAVSTTAGLRRWKPALLLLLFSTANACGDGPTDPGDGNPAGNATMAARVDGTAWTATSATAVVSASQFIGVAGATVGPNSLITFGFPAAIGTYQIPGEVGLNFGYSDASGKVWQAIYIPGGSGLGSGTLTVTTLTGSRVAGTFSFTAAAVAASGATGTRTVTDGTFDLRF